MPSASARGLAFVVTLLVLLVPTFPVAQPLALVHQQRYAMGTMFDIAVYHSSRKDAERTVAKAMDEIIRLDRVLSHFRADSDLSTLVRGARTDVVTAEPSLYAVIEMSLAFSRRSGGSFDVTIAPLVRTWKEARENGRIPSSAEIEDARRCVGYEKIEASVPNQIRFRSACVDIDLGAIGKGYAVDRAMDVLTAAGIRHASINAGTSTIGAKGSLPGGDGWPVTLVSNAAGTRTVQLRDASISTSQQNGEILDAFTGRPIESELTVSVIAPSAAMSDVLSTTMLLLPVEKGQRMLAAFTGVSAFWISPAGELTATYPASGPRVSDAR
jgi:thiamine biosynthesis lipoprotein ApbE